MNTYIEKVKQLFNRIPGKTGILLAIIMLIVIWFILPHIPVGKSYPFASTGAKTLLTLLAALGWGLKLLFTQVQQHKANFLPLIITKLKNAWNMIKSGGRNAWSGSRSYAKNLKSKAKQDKDKRRLRKLPWYLVLGSPQSGKKSLIANLGMYFAQPKHFGEDAENYIRQFPDYDWWFSEQSVFVDAMSHIKESESQSWKRFLKLLKRERKNKPINGIILTFSLADILLYSNQKRQEFIQDTCLYIRGIHQVFKSQVPIYIVFTKADLVEGFMEFFNDLSKEDLRQVWGMTLPLNICDDPNQVMQFYHEEYGAIVDKLRSQVLWSLNTERNPRGRELIHSFPQQMQLLRRPIETFITELFSGVRFQKALQLRGLYFASSKQEGEPHDFLLQAMSKKFQLVPPVVQRPERMGECYFLRRLFHDVIYPEAKLLGDSERSRKMRKMAYHTVRVAAPALIILTIVGMHEGYKANKQNIKAVEANIADFQQLKLQLNPNDDSVVKMLPMLRQLNDAKLAYEQSLPFSMSLLFETDIIRHHINNTMQRVLSNLFIPRIAAQIENNLNQNIANQNLLYATLKGYLAFSSITSTEQSAIKAPMEYNWGVNFKNKPAQTKELRYYLNLALEESVTKLPLDGQLISRIRSELEAIIPSKRAYGLLQLKASVGELPKLIISSAAGSHFREIFDTDRQDLTIPALYTQAGFNKIFMPQYQQIAEEVAQDNQEVGLAKGDFETQTEPQIEIAMQATYQRLYEDHWNKALSSIKVKPFDSLKNAIASIELLVGGQSPMAGLFTLVYNNTSSISTNQIHVDKKFHNFNNFQMGDSANSWHATQKILLAIQNYLMQIQQSPDQDKAEYDAVLTTIKTGKSPIIDLTIAAKKAPEPIREWLETIANNAWAVLISGAHKQVNTMWQADVMQDYNANIAGRYPIDPHSSSEVSMSAFDDFYGSKGTLSKFFSTYIEPFVQTDKAVWKLYTIQGHTFELSPERLELFQRAVTVQNQYFPNGSSEARLNFSIKPIMLDANASSISFVIGRHYINYSHGPQNTTVLNWPLPEDSQNTQIVLSTFNGGQYAESNSGPWALFKMLDRGEFKEQNKGEYLFTISIHGYNAIYEFNGSGDKSIYKLSSLKNYRLPNDIASDKGE